MRNTTVMIDELTCIGCGACVDDCFPGAIHLQEGIAMVVGPCIECGHCVAICPTQSVSIPTYDMADVEEVVNPALDPAHVLHAIKSRRSIRSYQTEHLPSEVLDLMIQAARYTPTARNEQGTRFIVVQNELPAFKELFWSCFDTIVDGLAQQGTREAKIYSRIFKQMHKAYKEEQVDKLFFNAPVFMLVITDNMWDGGLAAANIEIAATAQGAGVLHSGYLKRIISSSETLTQWLGIQNEEIACCMLAGYPKVSYPRTAPRKPAAAIVR